MESAHWMRALTGACKAERARQTAPDHAAISGSGWLATLGHRFRRSRRSRSRRRNLRVRRLQKATSKRMAARKRRMRAAGSRETGSFPRTECRSYDAGSKDERLRDWRGSRSRSKSAGQELRVTTVDRRGSCSSSTALDHSGVKGRVARAGSAPEHLYSDVNRQFLRASHRETEYGRRNRDR